MSLAMVQIRLATWAACLRPVAVIQNAWWKKLMSQLRRRCSRNVQMIGRKKNCRPQHGTVFLKMLAAKAGE